MKVVFTQTLATDREVFVRGKEYDVSPEFGTEVTKKELAKLIISDPPTPAKAEPTFGGHPLSFFDGKTDADIIALPSIDKVTLKKIRDAQAIAKAHQTPLV